MALAGLLVLLGSVTASAVKSRRVYVANRACSGKTVKPARIVIACADAEFYVAKLKYSSYGGATAKAHGTLRADTCTPNCASGKFKSYKGNITLSRIVRCKGVLYYSRIKWTYVKSRPPHVMRSGTANIQPLSETCSSA